MVLCDFGARKFFQLFLFPFPFYYRTKNKILKSYSVLKLNLKKTPNPQTKPTTFSYILCFTMFCWKWQMGKMQTGKNNFFWNFAQDMLTFFENSVLFICKLEKQSGTTRLQLNKKGLYMKEVSDFKLLVLQYFLSIFHRKKSVQRLWVSLCWRG